MRLDFEQSDITLLVNSDQRGVQHLPRCTCRYLQRGGASGLGQGNTNLARSLDDVSIGEDIPVGIDNDARADRTLIRDIASIALLDRWSVSRDHDLNDRSGNAVRERNERGVELGECVGST